MLSYPVDEAETLLESKLSTAKTSLSNCEEDLDFLREQITVGFTSGRAARSMLIECRPWRSRLREYTTGKSFKSAKTRRKERTSRRKRAMARQTADSTLDTKLNNSMFLEPSQQCLTALRCMIPRIVFVQEGENRSSVLRER